MTIRTAWIVLVILSFPLHAMALEQVKGTATCLQRIAVPPQAVFEARVENVSKAGAMAEVLGSVHIEGPGNPPIAFFIEVDPKRIDARFSYSVRASITVDGQLYMVTDQAYPVLTRGHGNDVELLLRPVSRPGGDTDRQGVSALGQLPASFSGDLPCADCVGIRYRLNLFPDRAFFLSTAYLGRENDGITYDIGSWALSSDHHILVLQSGREAPVMFSVVDTNTLRKRDIEGREIESRLNYTIKKSEQFERIEPRLAMRGMYRYMADAGNFTECLTRQRWPVAQEGGNASVEREYGTVRQQPGEPLLMHLEGRVEMRPGMEGDALHPTLVVDRYIGVWPGETCEARFATESLENTYWKLTRLGDKPVFVQEQQREPSLIFHPENHRISGSSGCNRLIGSYILNEEKIGFGQFASTKMACLEGMDQEQAFLAVLAEVRTWNVSGQHLELYDAKGELLARFEARHLR